MKTDSFDTPTQERFKGTPLWRDWMGSEAQLVQITSIEELEQFIKRNAGTKLVSWDVETMSLDDDPAGICGHCLAFKSDEAVYIPVRHTQHPEMNLDPDIVWKMVLDTFKGREIVVYNWMFEGAILRRAGVQRPSHLGSVRDVMMYRWLWDTDDKSIGLKDSAQRILGFSMNEIHQVPGITKAINFALTNPEEATLYAAADPVMTLRIYEAIGKKIETEQEDILRLEHKLQDVLFKMQNTQVTIDRGFLQQALKDIDHWTEVTFTRCLVEAGEEINPGSSQHVGMILEKRNVPGLKRTPTGKIATSAKELEALAGKDKFVDAILLYRKLTKEKSTYINALLDSTTQESPYTTFKFKQWGAPTGRFASGGVRKGERFTKMNAQSIPSADKFELTRAHWVKNPPIESPYKRSG